MILIVVKIAVVSIIPTDLASVIIYAPVIKIAVVIIPLSVVLLVLQFWQVVIQVIVLAEVVTKERREISVGDRT